MTVPPPMLISVREMLIGRPGKVPYAAGTLGFVVMVSFPSGFIFGILFVDLLACEDLELRHCVNSYDQLLFARRAVHAKNYITVGRHEVFVYVDFCFALRATLVESTAFQLLVSHVIGCVGPYQSPSRRARPASEHTTFARPCRQ